MENKIGWAIVALTAAGIVHLMIGLASVHGQTLNSDPEFVREGPKSYMCRTPNNRKVHCNRWLMVSKRGWKKACVKPNKSIFTKLPDPFDRTAQIEHPESGCAALFDHTWADYRRWDKKDMEKEAARQLRPAEFHQFVELKEEGAYEVNSCMVRQMHPTEGFSENVEDWSNLGGV